MNKDKNEKLTERKNRQKIILNGAIQSYSKYGIEGMTMDNIALESDFGKATIYYYFPSKDDIICSLMEQGWIDLWESVEEVVVQENSPRKKFVSILNNMAEIVYQNKILYEFLFTIPKHVSIPDSKATWKAFQMRTYATMQSIISEGISSGDFANIKPDLFMKAIGGIFHGIVFMGDQKPIQEKDIETLISSFITT